MGLLARREWQDRYRFNHLWKSIRPGSWALLALGGVGLTALLSLGHALLTQDPFDQRLSESRAWVQGLPLTDLALFTEARYTRHPTMADYHAAFQNHPGALETFPSGTLMPPPAHLRAPPLTVSSSTAPTSPAKHPSNPAATASNALTTTPLPASPHDSRQTTQTPGP